MRLKSTLLVLYPKPSDSHNAIQSASTSTSISLKSHNLCAWCTTWHYDIAVSMLA